jgi:hypothetical protein
MEITTSTINELDFAPYLFLTFEEVGKLLKEEPTKISGFIDFLFDLIEKKVPLSVGVFNIPTIDIRVLLTWCTWILVGGEEPNSYLSQLKANSKSKVCTKVWNDGYYFYRCRNCEQTPSRCFRNQIDLQIPKTADKIQFPLRRVFSKWKS